MAYTTKGYITNDAVNNHAPGVDKSLNSSDKVSERRGSGLRNRTQGSKCFTLNLFKFSA
jgi:hypothetical protein